MYKKRIRTFLKLCEEYRDICNQDIRQYMQNKIEYLGLKKDSNSEHKTQDKIDTIIRAKRCQTVTQLKSFLGVVNYYGRVIHNLADKLNPLHRLLKKEEKFQWDQEQQSVFDGVKKEF